MTVLVVDDEESDRNAIVHALRSQRCSVLEASSYAKAIAVFESYRHTVRLLIADIALPDGNGCALAIALHQQQPDLRVLFVSGHVGSEVCKYYGLDVDALHFLRKRFGESHLIQRIENVLNAEETFPKLYIPKTATSARDRG